MKLLRVAAGLAAGVEIPGKEGTRQNRLAVLRPLTRLAAGPGVGVARAVSFRPNLLLASVMAGADAPMTAVGVSAPGTWTVKDWLSDAAPHLAYGLVAAAVV